MNKIITCVLTSFFGMLLIRCKKKAEDQSQTTPIVGPVIKKEPEEQKPVETPSAPANITPYKTPTQTQQACFKNLAFPIEKISNMPEELKVKFTLYQKKDFFILGYQILHYRHSKTPLSSIYLCQEDGALIAQKGFSTFKDVAEDESFKPSFFERKTNLKGKMIFLIFVTNTQKSYKCPIPLDNNIKPTFQNKTVISSVIESNLSTQRPFVPKKDRFYMSANTIKLSVVSDEQVYNPKGFRDVIVADVAGNILSQLGQEFNEMTKYSIFICYYPLQENSFIQTIVRS